MTSSGPSRWSRRRRLRSLFGAHVLVMAALAGSLALGWACCIPAVADALHRVTAGPVYGLPELRAVLERDPAAWLGRTQLVRGTLAPGTEWTCSHVAACAVIPPGFILFGVDGHATRLAVRWGPADPLLVAWRRLPLLGRFAPRPRAPQWGVPAIYRVQVQSLPGRSSSPTDEVEVVVLDTNQAG